MFQRVAFLVDMSGWIEIRPLLSSEIKPGSFIPFLNGLQGSGKPFRFLMVDAEDPEAEGKRTVRFFLQFADEEQKQYGIRVLDTAMNAEIVEVEPPNMNYTRCLDLELAGPAAYPICELNEKQPFNIIDRIVSSLAGTGCAVEVVARGDPKGAVNIESEIYELEHGKASWSKAFTDMGVGMLAEATVRRDIHDVRREKWWEYGQQYKVSARRAQAIEIGKRKTIRPLFTCSIRIYGNGTSTLEGVEGSLPSFINRFRSFRKVRGRKVKPADQIRAPSRYTVRNILASLLRIGIPAALLAVFISTDILNLKRILTQGISLSSSDFAAILTLIIAVFSAIAFFRRRNPIILTDIELSQIIGFPSSVGKLPVAVGRFAAARQQLGSGETAQPPTQESVGEGEKPAEDRFLSLPPISNEGIPGEE
jgi:hypothetical protein